MVDRGRGRFGKFGGEFVKPDILGVNQGIDVAEGQQVVFGIEAEDFEHRLRPEDTAAREIPIPQAAPAAVQCCIDAAADGFVDQVSFPRACCLPMEGEAEDEDDKSGRRRQGDRQSRKRPPLASAASRD